MAKSASIGQMNTQITVQSIKTGIDGQGFPKREWTSLFDGQKVWCMWVNAHGMEIYDRMRLDLDEVATLTMRYTPLIDVRCRIIPNGDPPDDDHAWEIISLDNVENRRRTLEIKVQRKRVKA